MKGHIAASVIGWAFVGWFSVAAPAMAQGTDLPPVQQAGSGSYICGGIGLDESTAIKAAAAHYPLQLTFAVSIGQRSAYVADAKVSITAADGTSALNVTCDGPYLLADLPAGRYKVAAEVDGVSKSQTTVLAKGLHKKLVFLWTSAGKARD